MVYSDNRHVSYDPYNVIGEINEIVDKISDEEEKPLEEQDKRRLKELEYAQFIKGLKLSTRNNFQIY